ncbi:MAG: M20/M25/M40 family metallo-hydrolase, partial [Planctomycetes bacterium]|nr:M20/M25/M40 family metallo-hydrolase [Planctomycetota bacterium]
MACALLTAMLAGPLSFNRAQDVGRDEAVVSALARIDSQQIRANLTRLVGFGTRHALSDPKPDDRGARAASDWIHAMFRRAAASSSGRMTVSFDAFDPRDYARGGEQRALANLGVTEIRNVIAKLEGTEPDRVIIVSGHYDSRVSQRYDAGSDAPGANDDGSGTVAVLELARALADVPTRASIWFVAMTAEELGLWGSQNLAKFCDEND